MKKNVISLEFNENGRPLRCIRSFVRHQGRLTKGQKHAFNNYWSEIGIEFSEQILNFITVFGCDKPITLEIGFGMGDSLVSMAKGHPEHHFLGIEVYMPGVGACIASAYEEKVDNLRVMYHDAVEVLYKMIPNDSLNKVQIFFPDPWHKARHNKRRIIQVPFAKLVRSKLKKGGIFHIATDWKPYAQHILKVMSSLEDYYHQSENDKYMLNLASRPITKFEQRSHRLGHSVWELIFLKG